jgi:hypothetical protein
MRDAILVAVCVVDFPIVRCSEKSNNSETSPSDFGKGKGKGVWGIETWLPSFLTPFDRG